MTPSSCRINLKLLLRSFCIGAIRQDQRYRNLAMQTNLNTLEGAIDYKFKDRTLLEMALKHSSLEIGVYDNERLEFLGDAVLELVVAEAFYLKFSEQKEGELSWMRTNIVNGNTLASKALKLGLDQHLVVSEAQRAHHPEPSNGMLEDTLEALIGAIYLDGGLEAARHSIERIFGNAIRQAVYKRHPKNRLQEWAHKHHKDTQLVYKLASTEGPAHARVYHSTVELDGLEIGKGSGNSKKAAQVTAADNALKRLRA